MAKIAFGEYAGYTTPGGVRFQYQGKLVAASTVPPEVVEYISKRLVPASAKPTAEPKFAMPSEEELAKMREDSLKVKPELELTPEQEAQRVVTPPIDPATPPEQPPEIEEEVAVPEGEPFGEEVTSDFLESVSIHTAPLQDIAEALYNRFGIYTVYLGTLPRADEINPLTAGAFTKYHLGIAYQAAIYAQNQGLLKRVPEEGRKVMDANRAALEGASVDPVAYTLGEARQNNSFAYRTSVRKSFGEATSELVHEKDPVTGEMVLVRKELDTVQEGQSSGARTRFSAEDDELIVEPPKFGQKIIRPNW